MPTKRYVYDFQDFTAVHGSIPLHQDGTPLVHTWLWDVPGETCACNGRAHFEPNPVPDAKPIPMVKPHIVGAPREYDRKRQLLPAPAGTTHSVDRRVNAFEIVEADLEDGSKRSQQIAAHLERGACHEVTEGDDAGEEGSSLPPAA